MVLNTGSIFTNPKKKFMRNKNTHISGSDSYGILRIKNSICTN